MAALIRESGIFDDELYLSDPALREAGVDPVLHYVRHGAREGRRASPLFDPEFYLQKYPDVAEAGLEPLFHFVGTGARELRDPHPWFDSAYYAAQVPLLAEIGMNPVAHYLRVGAASGRRPHPDFDPQQYHEQHPEVAAEGIDPLLHFLGSDDGSGEAARGARSSWPHRSSSEDETGSRIAVVLHLYYPDLWDEVLGYLSNLGERFDLFVSLCSDTAGDVEQHIRNAVPDVRVRYLANRGRDVAPFVELLTTGALAGYELVCKIHSKKSLHRGDGDRWRGTLLHQLLGAPEIISEIRDVFDADPAVGILGPGDQLDRREESWGSNRERMVELAAAMGLDESDVSLSFFAGSMFWFRPAAFDALAGLGLGIGDFESEEGQLDGTLHHALERMFPLAVRASGYRVHPFHRPAHAARVGHGDRRPTGPVDRLLSAAVPSDSGERRVVGARLHGVVQRRAGAAAVRRARAAAAPEGSRLLRSPRSRDARGAGCARAPVRDPRLLLLLLLVRRPAAARATARRRTAERSTGLPVLRLLGERELDAPLGRTRLRSAGRAGILAGLGEALHSRVDPGVPRSALHPARRPPGAARVPRPRDPAARGDARTLALRGRGRRDRAPPRRGPLLGRGRRPVARLRRQRSTFRPTT